MKESNQELLDAKSEEIRRQIEAWAKNVVRLPIGKRIVVDILITIESSPAVVVNAEIGRKGKVVSSKLKDKDWDVLLALPLNNEQRAVIEFFRAEGNREFSRKEMEAHFSGRDIDPFLERYELNRVIKAGRLRYRLGVNPGVQRARNKMQFVITT